MQTRDLLIVGSGLAGLVCAVHFKVINPTKTVLVLEKTSQIGGNSLKASSGITLVDSKFQRQQGIADSCAIFLDDAKKGKCGKLIPVLARKSVSAELFLERCGVVLDQLHKLGGHSVARAHTNSKQIGIGRYLVGQVFQKAKAMGVEFWLDKPVTRLLQEDSSVTGVEFDDESYVLSASVVLATGGYIRNLDLLNVFHPEERFTPTSSGPQATGDGIELGLAVGCALADMAKLQIHPTGIVDPADPQNPSKFLAPESIRGLGGELWSTCGARRIGSELACRDELTAILRKEPGYQALLRISQEKAKPLAKLLDFYVSKKLCKLDTFGYEFCVTPILHYSLGGVAVDSNARVINKSGFLINDLYAAGETTGGIQGENRLGGNSLLDCVVFGMVAAESASNSNGFY